MSGSGRTQRTEKNNKNNLCSIKMISNYIALVAFIVMHITGHEILLDGISEMQIRKKRNVLEAIGMVFLEQSRINYNDFYSNSNVPTGSGYLISRYLSNSNDELTV